MVPILMEARYMNHHSGTRGRTTNILVRGLTERHFEFLESEFGASNFRKEIEARTDSALSCVKDHCLEWASFSIHRAKLDGLVA
jgi:hypothetical protein